jgi:hypothetical protein
LSACLLTSEEIETYYQEQAYKRNDEGTTFSFCAFSREHLLLPIRFPDIHRTKEVRSRGFGALFVYGKDIGAVDGADSEPGRKHGGEVIPCAGLGIVTGLIGGDFLDAKDHKTSG